MQDTFALNGFLPHFICIFDRETRFTRDARTPTPRFPPNQYRRFRLFTSLLSAVVSRQCCNSEVFLGNVKWCYQFRCSVEITFVTLLYADLWSWGSSLHCYYWSLVLVREPIRPQVLSILLGLEVSLRFLRRPFHCIFRLKSYKHA